VPLHYQDVRVLVVDDQPFNREIVQGLLAVVGITPQLASDGQQALDLIATAEPAFDLVLMDIQMPVMDGLTATRAIRRQGCGARLPIIAMTAHTMAHEKGKSILAGMNDHIGKPFDEADFYRVLSKWMPHGKQQPPMVASPPPQPTPTSGEKQGRAQEGEGEEAAASTFPLLHGIDTQAGMALLLGNEARYRHWLIDFMAKTPATLTQIRRDLANDDAKSAIMATHSLRGRMGLLGMKDLHVTATALEMAIESATEAATESTTNCAATNDEDNHELNALLLALEQSVMAICAEIQRGFGLDNSGAPPSAPWSEAVGPLLAEGVPTENGRA
jgi:CheY-like chemotaxis protein